jgi:hypothetical protein
MVRSSITGSMTRILVDIAGKPARCTGSRTLDRVVLGPAAVTTPLHRRWLETNGQKLGTRSSRAALPGGGGGGGWAAHELMYDLGGEGVGRPTR